MNERPSPHLSKESYSDAREQADDILEALMNRFESPLPLNPGEYAAAAAGVDRANELFAEADVLDQPATITCHSDHIYLPQLTYCNTIWPENTARIPASYATNEPYYQQKGIFRGISLAHDANDAPILYYHLHTRNHELDDFAYQAYAEVHHSLIMLDADWDRPTIDLHTFDAEDDPALHAHLEVVAQFANDIRQDEAVDFKEVVQSINFLLNNSALRSSIIFRQQLAQLFQEAFPRDVETWHIEASRAIEQHTADDHTLTYTPIDQRVSIESPSFQLECRPRMRTRYRSEQKTPHVRTNTERYDLYIIAPSLSGTSTLLIPFDALQDLYAPMPDEDSPEE